MHPFSLSEQTVARMVAKQGRAHMIEHVEPARTALIVVDMQNYFMAPGQQFETPTARAIVPNVNRLARALRGAGGSVVWIENVARPPTATATSGPPTPNATCRSSGRAGANR